MKKNNYINQIILWVLIIVITILIYTRVTMIKEIINVILIASIIAYVMKPLHRKMIEKGINKRLSAIIILVIFISIAVIFLVLLVPNLINESPNYIRTITDIEEYCSRLYNRSKYIKQNEIINKFILQVQIKGKEYFYNSFELIIEKIIKAGGNAFSFIVTPIIVYYFLSDSDLLGKKVIMMCPYKKRNIIKKIFSDIDNLLTRYILSQFLLCVLISILTYIILVLIGVKYAPILSFFNGFLNIIPYFGPILGIIPAILVALLQSPKTALITTIGLYAIQLIEGNIISPKIIGKTVNMHPLLVILLLIIGGKISGFLGMVLAVPMGVIIKVIYEDINYYMF